jgi:N utilization substance protein A
MSTPETSDDDIRRLFEKHVPEVASGGGEIVAIAREPGDRVLVAVRSHDPAVHPVSACVGERGIHPKSIVRELHGEKVGIVLWSEKPENFILSALAPFGSGPVQTPRITLDPTSHVALVQVTAETLAYFSQQPPARLWLASKLVGWDIRLIQQ